MESTTELLIRECTLPKWEDERICTSMTFFLKYIFTTLYIGGFGSVSFLCFFSGMTTIGWIFLSIWLTVSPIIWLCMGRIKYVAIDGHSLVISNYISTLYVPFQEIAEVYQKVSVPELPVWIRFKQKTIFGTKVMFLPTTYLGTVNDYHPIVHELNSIITNQKCLQAFRSMRLLDFQQIN